jgi:hypothetical protein
MATIIYLSNDPSDVALYKKAYIGGRSPNASTTISTAVTATTSSGDDIPATLTSGGAAAQWITAPLVAAVTVTAKPVFNFWALESNAAANAQLAIKLAQYTTSIQSAFVTSKYGTEATTAALREVWAAASGDTVTSTAFAIGDRIAILPYCDASGTMGASQTLTFDYNGLTAGADGDSYVILNETLQAGVSQYGSGLIPFAAGTPGVQAYQGIIDYLVALRDGGLFGAEAMLKDLLLELAYQRDLHV